VRLDGCNGDFELCANLTEFDVEYNIVTEGELTARCGIDTLGCADVNLTLGNCIITLTASSSESTKIHEQNHCRGWDHDYHNYSWAFRSPKVRWKPWEVVMDFLKKRKP
jgi:hypothetical protein